MNEKSGLHLDSHCDCEVICEDIMALALITTCSHATFLGFTTLWETIVCPKDLHFEWHSRDCVFGKCQDCGVENLTFYPIEEEGISNVLVH
jgi:hypothetical protein